MPSDNSCLFTAFGGALPQQIPPLKLRQMMADYINQHLDVYTEAVLGAPTEEYCRAILNPDRWGGGIELSILSSIFNIRICTYDIQVSQGPKTTSLRPLNRDSIIGVDTKPHCFRRGQNRAMHIGVFRNPLRSRRI